MFGSGFYTDVSRLRDNTRYWSGNPRLRNNNNNKKEQRFVQALRKHSRGDGVKDLLILSDNREEGSE